MVWGQHRGRQACAEEWKGHETEADYRRDSQALGMHVLLVCCLKQLLDVRVYSLLKHHKGWGMGGT